MTKHNAVTESVSRTEQTPNNTNTEIIVEWILNAVDCSDIPPDEGNDEAFIYNLVHLARDGRDYTQYNYEPEQDNEIKSWKARTLQ